MTRLQLPDWIANFTQSSPVFEPLQPLARHFSHLTRWPCLEELQALLRSWSPAVRTLTGQLLRIVGQDGQPAVFEQHYAPRIYFTGELQTRSENWHDFFQFLSWLMFPRTKALINALHIAPARERMHQGQDVGRRSPLENMLSLFDEGGAVLVSSNPDLLALVREFRWKSLFWDQRETLAQQFACVGFGHALYEKGLVPYLGMTANCILLEASPAYFALDWPERWAWIDEQLLLMLSDRAAMQGPRDLQPFPVLGMPGWDDANAVEQYYDNTSYFRPGRRQ